MEVVVGAHDFTAKENTQRRYRVKRIVKHHKYWERDESYDVMLLQLETSIEYYQYASPICFDSTTFANGTDCVSTGWGNIVCPYHIFASCALCFCN